MNRSETIEETAEGVTARGGKGVSLRVDHTAESEVQALFERVRRESGRLDLLVNDVWGGDPLTEWGRPFWELSLSDGFSMQRRAVHSHIITNRYGAPLMLEGGQGLIIEVTDGDGFAYRGNLFYDLAKVSVMRLAFAMATELKGHGITALALTPGFLRSEAVLDYLGVTEANWREGAKKDPTFAGSETPHFIGRAVVALAGDPDIAAKAGTTVATWDLARAYGFRDVDGRQPHWQDFYRQLQQRNK
jgi:NAD(P)-dependent dehydrogenase (short-subunit alcohol dehydrogenase family)